MSEYYSIITDAGAALEAAAIAGGPPVVLTQFAAGDGGGFPVAPTPPQVALVNEVYRGNLSSLTVGEQPNVMVAQGIIPKESGGYTVREIGIFTQEGILYSVSNYPDQIKPAPDSGYAAKLEIRYSLAVSGTEDITLLLKPGDYLTEERANTLYPRTVNSHSPDPAGAINVTTIDIFRDQAIQIGDAVDLNTLVEPGLYYQPLILQAQTGANYPEPTAGSLEILKHAGITQVFRVYAGSRSYSRSLNEGVWSGWSFAFNAENPPTAEGINAVLKTGDTMTGALTVLVDNHSIAINPPNEGMQSHIAATDQNTAAAWRVGNIQQGNSIVTLRNDIEGAGISIGAASMVLEFPAGQPSLLPDGNILGAAFNGDNLMVHLNGMVNGIQFGAVIYQPRTTGDDSGSDQQVPSGCVQAGLATSPFDSSDTVTGIYYKPQQVLISGSWVNVVG